MGERMKLKNILLVVDNIKEAKEFYRELFGLEVVMDFEENVILTEGLVLQEKRLWESFTHRQVKTGGNDAELYFEENDIDGFLAKLKQCKWDIPYVNECMEHAWGQRVIRIYDLDKHIIEIGEELSYVARRFLKEGMSVKEVAKKTQLPLSQIEQIRIEIRK